MKFIIIGAGALGSLYAAYLARDGAGRPAEWCHSAG